MPLIINGGRVPSHWAERENSRPLPSLDSPARRAETLNLALINNMPDAALEATELQFFELLDIASGDLPVIIKLYSLSGVPRADRGQRHINSFYYDFEDLWNSRLDGMIVTGTEPRETDLRNEPYWGQMAKVFNWAEENTASTVLSCLAAHASVLHFDGIPRHRLPDKQFGVFESGKSCEHPLLSGVGGVLRFPHSRWNELRESELTASGYLVLAKAADAGVDLFVKKKKKSLFVHFQGHPEYGAQTLLKEYRRDIRRFLGRERETYPSMPKDYFDAAAAELLTGFRDAVLTDRREELIEGFPEGAGAGLRNTWQSSAVSIYQNWLQFLTTKRTDVSEFSAMPIVYHQASRKRSALP